MRGVAAILILVGLYVLVEWGILGKSPLLTVSKTADAAAGAAGGGSPGGTSSGAPLPSSLFGFSGIFSGFGERLSALVANADPAGLKAFGSSSTFAHDMDYAVAAGTPVKLPGAASDGCYTYLGNQQGGWGNLLGFRTPNGGVMEFAHFSSVPALEPGVCYPGGTGIGLSGGRPGIDVPDSRYSTGPHVAVIVDQTALGWLNRILLPSGLRNPFTQGAA